MEAVGAIDTVELFPEVAKMPLFWANLTVQEKIAINQGGTYSGKSQSLIRVMFFYAMSCQDIKIEVVAATVPKLVSDTLEIAELLWTKNKLIRTAVLKYNSTKHTFFFKNGAKIIFKSYETAKDADGPKRDILYISEARNFEWNVAEQLIKRTSHKVFIDYNPVETFWAHEKLINCPVGRNGRKEYPSVKVIRSWHIHNQFIPQEKHDEIEDIEDEEMHKAYARGLTATLSGMCYPKWKKIDQFPLCKKIIWGLDLGYTNDPTCLVKVGLEPYYIGADGLEYPLPYDYIFEEFTYAPGIASGAIAKILTENGYKFGQPVYMDHDKTVRSELKQLRIVAIFAVKGKDCIKARVLHLRTRRCAYTKSSENIDKERKKYMFFVDKTGKVTNEPVEGNDHAMNACEYGAFSHAVRTGLIRGYEADDAEEKEAA